MKLYEIANEYLALMQAIDEGEIPEDAIADTLEAVEGGLEVKVDNIACVLKTFEAEAVAIREEEKKLAKRRKVKENAAERMRQYLSNALQHVGLDNFETARNRISFRKSEAVEIADENAFISWALDNRPDLLNCKYTVSKTAIKEEIEQGSELAGAYIRTNNNIQIK